MKSSKKKTKKGKEPQTINLIGCQNVQVGDKNTILVETTEDDDIDVNTTEEGLLKWLTTLVKPHTSGMNLQFLETEFQKVYKAKKQESKTFKQINGLPLLRFLQIHRDIFLLKKTGHNWIVYLESFSNIPDQKPIQIQGKSLTQKTQVVKHHESDGDLVPPGRSTVRHHSDLVPPDRSTGAIPKKHYSNLSDRDRFSSYTMSPMQFSTRKKDREYRIDQQFSSENLDPSNLLKHTNSFKSGHFILMISEKRHVTKFSGLKALRLIDWLAVFDLDEESRKSGLLAVVEEPIKQIRSLYTCTWKDPPRISDYGTEWCLVRGSVQEPHSLTPADPKSWFRKVIHDFGHHLQEIAQFIVHYTVLNCVIVLPTDENDLKCIWEILTEIEKLVEFSPKIIIIDPGRRLSKEDWFYKMTDPSFVLQCDIEIFCSEIESALARDLPQNVKYRLPTFDETNDPSIDEAFAAGLRNSVDVLYLDNPHSKLDINIDVLAEEEDAFLRGGALRWMVFYELGAGHIDGKRDITQTIIDLVKQKFIDQFRSGTVQLYHAPGSGASTLMKRVLWELRTFSPCAQVKASSKENTNELVEGIENLYEKTKKPIVLLVDGDEDRQTRHLMARLEHVVIIMLHVKRYPHSLDNLKLSQNIFFLKGSVSPTEAKKIGMKFHKKCDSPEKEDAISQMVKEVGEGKERCVYEFGLATYLEGYKGISSFVRGYLQLDGNKMRRLEIWQDILGYLSLVYYYGQTSLPLQFFSNILSKPVNYILELSDFPEPVKPFIVFCDGEGRKYNIRIGHYILAKEILNQLLTWPISYDENEYHESISPSARQNLAAFSQKFIAEAKKIRSKASDRRGVVVDAFTKTFLYREIVDSPTDELSFKRKKVSKLLEDIPGENPHPERIQIIEKLSNCFPDNPSIHAHLGRLISIYKPEDVEKTENCFIKALSLCKTVTLSIPSDLDDRDFNQRITVATVHHMYGMFFLKRITQMTGYPGTRRISESQKSESKLLMLAEQAIENFTKNRDVLPVGLDDSYGYTGEIMVRLHVSEFILNYLPVNLEVTNPEAERFVKESCSEIQELIYDCFVAVEGSDTDTDLLRNITRYQEIFKDLPTGLTECAGPDDASTSRFKIAAIKLKYGGRGNIGTLEKITDSTDVEEIVKICEKIFKEVQRGYASHKRKNIEMNYKDWINAVRHPLYMVKYPLSSVLLHVREWNGYLNTPTSKFYLFCLLFVMGVEEVLHHQDNRLLTEAMNLRRDLSEIKKYIAKPKHILEWFGKERDIKVLIPANRFHGNVKNRAIQTGGTLKVWRGTICRPNYLRQTGQIELDLDGNRQSVQVFFVPVRAESKLIGSRYAGERVEFVLGINYNGLEAFNVKLLEKMKCKVCELFVEIDSDQSEVLCPCGKIIRKIQD